MEVSHVRHDYSLILHLIHKDCVVAEVQYHRSCFKRYTTVGYCILQSKLQGFCFAIDCNLFREAFLFIFYVLLHSNLLFNN